MIVKILGCSGGIGGYELQTSCILIGTQTLIDAGTGLASLPLEQLSVINNLFVTHSHMDHIAMAPMLVDSTSDSRKEPLKILALEPTIASLRKHIFNWEIWPDFSEIKVNGFFSQSFHSIDVGDSFDLPGGAKLIVGPALHQVPACSYLIVGPKKKLFFSGDTTYTPKIAEFINEHAPVEHIILECAFGIKEKLIAELSKHMYSEQVGKVINEVKSPSQFYITHLKPSQRDMIMNEINLIKTDHTISRLYSHQVFDL